MSMAMISFCLWEAGTLATTIFLSTNAAIAKTTYRQQRMIIPKTIELVRNMRFYNYTAEHDNVINIPGGKLSIIKFRTPSTVLSNTISSNGKSQNNTCQNNTCQNGTKDNIVYRFPTAMMYRYIGLPKVENISPDTSDTDTETGVCNVQLNDNAKMYWNKHVANKDVPNTLKNTDDVESMTIPPGTVLYSIGKFAHDNCTLFKYKTLTNDVDAVVSDLNIHLESYHQQYLDYFIPFCFSATAFLVPLLYLMSL